MENGRCDWRLPKIAIEEHYSNEALVFRNSHGDIDLAGMAEREGFPPDKWEWLWAALTDMGDNRIQQMDKNRIDHTIISITTPGLQAITDSGKSCKDARLINDQVTDAIRKHPERLSAFAALPMNDPEAGAQELKRAVTTHSFKGGLLNGCQNMEDGSFAFFDQDRYLPFWEAVDELEVPIYLHPRQIDNPFLAGREELMGPAWDFGVHTATFALRLITSGLFDRFPHLSIIIGHMGEMLPFAAWRAEHTLRQNWRQNTLKRRVQEYLAENFYITMGGNLVDQGLFTSMQVIGSDRIMFSTDYPYEAMDTAAQWMERVSLSETDRRKIAYGNAARLFGIDLGRTASSERLTGLCDGASWHIHNEPD